MSESSLIRLGVETLGDRIRIKERCKQFVDGERTRSLSSTSSSPSQQIIEERSRLFQPYRNSSRRDKSCGASKTGKRKNPPRRTWTGQFVCLADRQTCRVPSSTEKQLLQQAGLGLKKIRFFVDDSEEEVLEKLTSDVPGDDGLPTGFPQLKEGKGFELMSCMTNSRHLAVVKSSWSVEGLKTLFTPQTKIYLRPIQKNLRIKERQDNRLTCNLTEKCMWCSKKFPLNELRTHFATCNCNVFEDDAEDEVVVSSEDYLPSILSSATVTANNMESQSTGGNDTSSSSVSVPSNHSDSGSILSSATVAANNVESQSTGGNDTSSSSVSVPINHSDSGSINPVLALPSPDNLDVDIKLIMPKIKEHCRSTGLFACFYFEHLSSI